MRGLGRERKKIIFFRGLGGRKKNALKCKKGGRRRKKPRYAQYPVGPTYIYLHKAFLGMEMIMMVTL